LAEIDFDGVVTTMITRVAVVTGAAQGIGRRTAEVLADSVEKKATV